MDFFNNITKLIAKADKSNTVLKLNFDGGHVILDKDGKPVKDLKSKELSKFVSA